MIKMTLSINEEINCTIGLHKVLPEIPKQFWHYIMIFGIFYSKRRTFCISCFKLKKSETKLNFSSNESIFSWFFNLLLYRMMLQSFVTVSTKRLEFENYCTI